MTNYLQKEHLLFLFLELEWNLESLKEQEKI